MTRYKINIQNSMPLLRYLRSRSLGNRLKFTCSDTRSKARHRMGAERSFTAAPATAMGSSESQSLGDAPSWATETTSILPHFSVKGCGPGDDEFSWVRQLPLAEDSFQRETWLWADITQHFQQLEDEVPLPSRGHEQNTTALTTAPEQPRPTCGIQ